MEHNTKIIQKLCLDIALDIDRVCRQEGICYSLCGGSVIGMLLYKGFIPWDDDIDLMMTRKNYDRFLIAYQKYGNKRYRLLHYSTTGARNLPALFARVEDTWTEVREQIAGASRCGHVFVDVTVFDNVPSPMTARAIRLAVGGVITVLYRKNGFTPHTGWKRRLLHVLPMPRTEEGTVRLYTLLENGLRHLKRRREGGQCAELLSARFGDILYPAELFDEYVNGPFEGHSLMVVRRARSYLRARYGDREFTRDVPPEKRQASHIQEVIVHERD